MLIEKGDLYPSYSQSSAINVARFKVALGFYSKSHPELIHGLFDHLLGAPRNSIYKVFQKLNFFSGPLILTPILRNLFHQTIQADELTNIHFFLDRTVTFIQRDFSEVILDRLLDRADITRWGSIIESRQITTSVYGVLSEVSHLKLVTFLVSNSVEEMEKFLSFFIHFKMVNRKRILALLIDSFPALLKVFAGDSRPTHMDMVATLDKIFSILQLEPSVVLNQPTLLKSLLCMIELTADSNQANPIPVYEYLVSHLGHELITSAGWFNTLYLLMRCNKSSAAFFIHMVCPTSDREGRHEPIWWQLSEKVLNLCFEFRSQERIDLYPREEVDFTFNQFLILHLTHLKEKNDQNKTFLQVYLTILPHIVKEAKVLSEFKLEINEVLEIFLDVKTKHSLLIGSWVELFLTENISQMFRFCKRALNGAVFPILSMFCEKDFIYDLLVAILSNIPNPTEEVSEKIILFQELVFLNLFLPLEETWWVEYAKANGWIKLVESFSARILTADLQEIERQKLGRDNWWYHAESSEKIEDSKVSRVLEFFLLKNVCENVVGFLFKKEMLGLIDNKDLVIQFLMRKNPSAIYFILKSGSIDLEELIQEGLPFWWYILKSYTISHPIHQKIAKYIFIEGGFEIDLEPRPSSKEGLLWRLTRLMENSPPPIWPETNLIKLCSDLIKPVATYLNFKNGRIRLKDLSLETSTRSIESRYWLDLLQEKREGGSVTTFGTVDGWLELIKIFQNEEQILERFWVLLNEEVTQKELQNVFLKFPLLKFLKPFALAAVSMSDSHYKKISNWYLLLLGWIQLRLHDTKGKHIKEEEKKRRGVEGEILKKLFITLQRNCTEKLEIIIHV